jgi:hypothetical protein
MKMQVKVLPITGDALLEILKFLDINYEIPETARVASVYIWEPNEIHLVVSDNEFRNIKSLKDAEKICIETSKFQMETLKELLRSGKREIEKIEYKNNTDLYRKGDNTTPC